MDGHRLYLRIVSPFGKLFPHGSNPFHHLGSLTFFLFLVALVTGIYLFLFYRIDPLEAYHSTEAISRQWVGGLMRSMHRYSSDALVVTSLLHLVQTLLSGKQKRKLSWISGIFSISIIFITGVTGFILVWDQKAKLLGFLLAKLISSLPLISPSISAMFLISDLKELSGLFRITFAAHFFLSLFFLVVVYVHTVRLSKPKLFPTTYLMAAVTLCLAVISLFFPVQSDAPAEATVLPVNATFDWFYYAGIYPLKYLPGWTVWLIVLIPPAFLSILSFRKQEAPGTVPVVDPVLCNACGQCHDDCPYDAIGWIGQEGEKKALIDPSRCESCGICVASCKPRAMQMAGVPDAEELLPVMKNHTGVFHCAHSRPKEMEGITVNQSVPCVGDVNPKLMEQLYKGGLRGIVLAGCEDCLHRQGMAWTAQRMARKRRPALSHSVPRGHILLLDMDGRSRDEAIRKFAMSVQQNHSSESRVSGWLRYAGGIVMMLALLVGMEFFSGQRVDFYGKDRGMLILNFRYVSSAIAQTVSTAPVAGHAHPPVQIVSRRARVKLEVLKEGSGEVLFTRILEPGGIRSDMPVSYYKEIPAAGRLAVRLTEVEFPGRKFYAGNIVIDETDAAVVRFADHRLKVFFPRGRGE